MKISKKVPPVHVGRLRQQAMSVGCVGLVACIEQMSKSFLARKKMTQDDLLKRSPVVDKGDPVVDAALEELNMVIETKYGEQERQIEAEFAHEDDDDCTAIPRYFIQVAETLPTMREEVRKPLDNFFGEMAREQLAA